MINLNSAPVDTRTLLRHWDFYNVSSFLTDSMLEVKGIGIKKLNLRIALSRQ